MIYACKQHKNGYVWMFNDTKDRLDQLQLVTQSDKGKYIGLVEMKEYPALGVAGKRLRLFNRRSRR